MKSPSCVHTDSGSQISANAYWILQQVPSEREATLLRQLVRLSCEASSLNKSSQAFKPNNPVLPSGRTKSCDRFRAAKYPIVWLVHVGLQAQVFSILDLLQTLITCYNDNNNTLSYFTFRRLTTFSCVSVTLGCITRKYNFSLVRDPPTPHLKCCR